MAFYTMIGFIVVAAVIAAGVYWVLSNVSLKRQPERYTYHLDADGNAVVKDSTDNERT